MFDRGWAEAYERAGGSYYPKLQVAVPFTPATGRRLLVRPGPHADEVAPRAGRRPGRTVRHRTTPPASTSPSRPSRNAACSASSASCSAPTSSSTGRIPAIGSFDDFLAALASRKRKTIRRERHDALANGISVHWLTGSDLTEDAWDAFFAFYMETGSRKWGRPYLTRRSFR